MSPAGAGGVAAGAWAGVVSAGGWVEGGGVVSCALSGVMNPAIAKVATPVAALIQLIYACPPNHDPLIRKGAHLFRVKRHETGIFSQSLQSFQVVARLHHDRAFTG